MDELFSRALETINNTLPLEPVELPDELRRTTFPMRFLEIDCYNWKAEKLRKIYAMRMKVKVPSLDIIGMAFYPQPDIDAPIFAFDLSCTRKKVVTYINFIPLFKNEAYHKKYIEPLKPVYEQYNTFPPHRMPDWMKVYQTPCTIYTMPERSMLAALKNCALDYLSVYLTIIGNASKIQDPTYYEQTRTAQKHYIDDLLTRDASQRMLAKLIGSKKAGRIFQEVLV